MFEGAGASVALLHMRLRKHGPGMLQGQTLATRGVLLGNSQRLRHQLLRILNHVLTSDVAATLRARVLEVDGASRAIIGEHSTVVHVVEAGGSGASHRDTVRVCFTTYKY